MLKKGYRKTGRPAQVITAYKKALAGVGGLNQAIYIWRKLGVDKYHFEDPRAYTQEKLSELTWEDCTKKDYELNPGFYKRLAKMVIKGWRQLDDRCKVIRIYGKEADKFITKICRSDRKHAIWRQSHLVSIAGGCMASATDMNERLKLNQDLGKKLMQQIIQKLPDNYSTEEKKKLATKLTFETVMEAGEQVGKKQIVSGVLQILDGKPALAAKDKQGKDLFSKQANERREAQGDT